MVALQWGFQQGQRKSLVSQSFLIQKSDLDSSFQIQEAPKKMARRPSNYRSQYHQGNKEK